jgi:2-polyprenyl-3-methyl-5-hydroxy-6-metoxy-1,4-benzoquinol methylase
LITKERPPHAPNETLEAASAACCRCCGGTGLRDLGRIPDARIFAGKQLSAPLAGGTLYRCEECSFVFRYPIYPQAKYDRLYREGESDTWDDTDRIDHKLVRELIRRNLAEGTVLDVGCGGGRLLMPLAGEYDAFGVEINAKAAQTAEDRRVRIVASDIGDIASLERSFDAVVSCDVIEHLPDPLQFMRTLLSATAPGGLVVISTANANAWSWRVVGSRFWYCYLPEHISFVSPEWFKHHAKDLGAQVLDVRQYVYSPQFPLVGKALRLMLMGFFRFSPRLYYKALPQSKQRNIPVGRGITRDHFVIALRKL